MTSRPRRRTGFTLIELLMVIAIIMILATATFKIYRGVSNTRMKARGRGEIQRIVIACENFKKVYGDYPCALAGTSVSTVANQTQYRENLYDELTGVPNRRLLADRLVEHVRHGHVREGAPVVGAAARGREGLELVLAHLRHRGEARHVHRRYAVSRAAVSGQRGCTE